MDENELCGKSPEQVVEAMNAMYADYRKAFVEANRFVSVPSPPSQAWFLFSYTVDPLARPNPKTGTYAWMRPLAMCGSEREAADASLRHANDFEPVLVVASGVPIPLKTPETITAEHEAVAKASDAATELTSLDYANMYIAFADAYNTDEELMNTTHDVTATDEKTGEYVAGGHAYVTTYVEYVTRFLNLQDHVQKEKEHLIRNKLVLAEWEKNYSAGFVKEQKMLLLKHNQKHKTVAPEVIKMIMTPFVTTLNNEGLKIDFTPKKI